MEQFLVILVLIIGGAILFLNYARKSRKQAEENAKKPHKKRGHKSLRRV